MQVTAKHNIMSKKKTLDTELKNKFANKYRLFRYKQFDGLKVITIFSILIK